MKTIKPDITYHLNAYEELSKDDQQLIDAAKKASYQSYAPYSHFMVGAAAKLANGEIVCGSNQENAAYPSGLCAERTAIFYAGAAYPDVAIRKLAIISRQGDQFGREICSPCGACRQVICEAEARAGSPIEILLCSATEAYIFEGIDGLLPFGFSGKDLQASEK